MPISENQAIVKNDGTSFTPIPKGVYEVEIVDITFKPKEEQKVSKFEPKDKYYVKLGILTDGESRGKSITHFVSTSYNAGFSGGQASKLYELTCAVMDENIDDKVELDLNTLIGGIFVIMVKEKATADGRVTTVIAEVTSLPKGKKVVPLTNEEREVLLPKVDGEVEDFVDPSLMEKALDGVSEEDLTFEEVVKGNKK